MDNKPTEEPASLQIEIEFAIRIEARETQSGRAHHLESAAVSPELKNHLLRDLLEPLRTTLGELALPNAAVEELCSALAKNVRETMAKEGVRTLPAHDINHLTAAARTIVKDLGDLAAQHPAKNATIEVPNIIKASLTIPRLGDIFSALLAKLLQKAVK